MHFHRPYYLLLLTVIFITFSGITGCDKGEAEEEETPPPPFPELPEDNTGSRIRSVTYVYDRTAVDLTYPPKIDSSIILFSYTPTGKIDRIRLTHNSNFFVYDFYFERDAPTDKLIAIHCKDWVPSPYMETGQTDLALEYNTAGKVALMKSRIKNDPLNETDSFIIKYSANRIDTVIDRTFAVGTNADKYAFTYNVSGDITQIDDIRTSGVFFVYEEILKYTLSGSPAAFVLGDEAIFWNFFAKHVDVSSNTNFMIPPILFHSSKQPSKLVMQVSGFYTGTYNYQTEFYSSGRPKKMTADVITGTGAFYAREAYYYTYTQ